MINKWNTPRNLVKMETTFKSKPGKNENQVPGKNENHKEEDIKEYKLNLKNKKVCNYNCEGETSEDWITTALAEKPLHTIHTCLNIDEEETESLSGYIFEETVSPMDNQSTADHIHTCLNIEPAINSPEETPGNFQISGE